MLNIPRGEYRITQRKPIRYKLQSITGNTPNARQESATTAYCDLTEDDLGEVTFYNVLNQWNMWNGADVKTNHVGPAVEIPPELQGT